MSRSKSKSNSRRSSNYTAPSSNWKNLTVEEANGPNYKDSTWYSTTLAKSKFSLSTDNLRTIMGYRSSHKHYGGGNNLTLYRERDLLLFIDQRAGKTYATPEAQEQRRLEFRKQQDGEAQAKRDRSNKDSIVPAERLANLQINRLTEMVRYYEGFDCVIGAVNKNKTEWTNSLVNRIRAAGYTMDLEILRKEEIRAVAKRKQDAQMERIRFANELKAREQAAWVQKRAEQAKAKAAKLENIASGKLSWDDLTYQELQKECSIRKLIRPGLGAKKADFVARIVRYESESIEERKVTALLYEEQAKKKNMLDKIKREQVQKERNDAYKMERERQRLLAEERVKKAKMKKDKIDAMVVLILKGKAKWEELNCANLQEECQKRHLKRPYGKKSIMIERIKKYELLMN